MQRPCHHLPTQYLAAFRSRVTHDRYQKRTLNTFNPETALSPCKQGACCVESKLGAK